MLAVILRVAAAARQVFQKGQANLSLVRNGHAAQVHSLLLQRAHHHSTQAVPAHLSNKAALGSQQRSRARKNTRRPAGGLDHRSGILYAHARALRHQVHQQLAKGQDGFPEEGTGIGSVHFHLECTTFSLSQY